MSGLLITQCLQKDFVEPLDKFDPLPNALHVGYGEARRLLFGNTEEDPVRSTISWAYQTDERDLSIVHVRDWHNPDDPAQKNHLDQFGLHCIAESPGARFVFEDRIDNSRNHSIINATGLNDFVETNILNTLNPIIPGIKRVGIMGVWTEAKVYFTAYEFRTRYPDLEIAVCSALTASSSRQKHFLALDQLKEILGVQTFSSPGAFCEWLVDSTDSRRRFVLPSIKKHSRIDTEKLKLEGQIEENDRAILLYLFRNSKEVELKSLDGGFSGNLVLSAKAIDSLGHKQVPTVVKIGPRDMIAKERTSFERIQEVLGNNAPSIIDYAELSNRGGILYRYASMLDGKVRTFQDLFMEGVSVDTIKSVLKTVFVEQLGRLTVARDYEELNLLEYYEFSSKFSDSVANRVSEIAGQSVSAEDDFINDPVTGRTLFNVASFYGKVLKESSGESVAGGHYVSYLHGDLNGRNIIIDAHNNVWLIDFFHTHRGHVLRDLIKLENDILYIMTPAHSDSDVAEFYRLIDFLMNQNDLAVVPSIDQLYELRLSEGLQRSAEVILFLRSLYGSLIESDRDPYQMYVALLRYSVHTLSFDECNLYQKKAALYASCLLAERITKNLDHSTRLRFDFLDTDLANIAITILPGRKDRLRNLSRDIEDIRSNGFKEVLNLVTDSELYEYGVDQLNQEYKSAGLKVKHFPILDQKAPAMETLHDLMSWIDRSEKLLIHCVGGLGRSGLIAAIYLIEKGYDFETAVRIVRNARSERAIETIEQMDLVKRYADMKQKTGTKH